MANENKTDESFKLELNTRKFSNLSETVQTGYVREENVKHYSVEDRQKKPQGVKYIVEEGIKSKLKPLRGVSYVAVVVMLVCLVILLTVLLVTKDVTADEAAENLKEARADGWGPWSSLSDCSQTCGGGSQYRLRWCDSPRPDNGGSWCDGKGNETISCNTEVCPENLKEAKPGGWGPWSSFSDCSKTCGGGSQYRLRWCDSPRPNNGRSWCDGEGNETRSCNTEVCPGYVEMQVKPYPALIYQYAPPNTAVLNINAYDINTDQPLPSVSIMSGDDGEYFDVTQQARLPKEWVLRVKKQIDKPIGYVFDVNVYGYFNGTAARDRNVKINVTEKNLFTPSFEKESYEFQALRNGWQTHLTLIGTVKAIDLDKQFYNSEFCYHIDPAAAMYFHVDLLTGEIELIDDLPLYMSNMTFSVTAIDGGSPQLLNTTMVTVQITDVPPEPLLENLKDARDGGWGPWSSFSDCSMTCGGGSQYRLRWCDNPMPGDGGSWCDGEGNETHSCNTEVCPAITQTISTTTAVYSAHTGTPTPTPANTCVDNFANCASLGQFYCSDIYKVPGSYSWNNCRKYCGWCHVTITQTISTTTAVYTGPTQGPVGSTASPVCTYKGKTYSQGQHWQDACQYNCSCDYASIGYYRCRILCPDYQQLPPDCTLVTVQGQCCPRLDCKITVITNPPVVITDTFDGYGCSYNGHFYRQDETWNDGCSKTCTCTDASRRFYSCGSVCLNWDNLPAICHLEDAPPGKCCRQPQCPSGVVINIPTAYKDEYPKSVNPNYNYV